MLMPMKPPDPGWAHDIQQCTRLALDDYDCNNRCPFLCQTPISELLRPCVGVLAGTGTACCAETALLPPPRRLQLPAPLTTWVA